MREKNKDSTKKLKKINIIINVTLLIILFIVIVRIRYAKYIEPYMGEANAHVADMICEMEVITDENSGANENVKNPYRIVKVKNYKFEENITKVDVNYTIKISSKNGEDLPDYYWQTSDGKILYKNCDCTGSFTHENKEEIDYTIVFTNSGEDEINRKITFKLVATQANN